MSTPLTSPAPDAPSGSSNPVSLKSWFTKITDWIMSLSPAGASVYDTGWLAYTPTVSGMTNMGATGRYRRVGKAVRAEVTVAVSGASVASGNGLQVTVPLALNALAAHQIVGDATLIKGSTRHAGALISPGAGPQTSVIVRSLGTNGLLTATSATSPFTWASGDQVLLALDYTVD